MGWIKRLFKRKNKLVKAYFDVDLMELHYEGGQVLTFAYRGFKWYTYPMLKELNMYNAAELSEILRYIEEHGNPYPIAHLGDEDI